MAEVFGVVASGMGVVSLAFQVADSVKKLKDFYGLMKDAPEDIHLALDEVEVLSIVLEDIDRDIQQQLFPSPAIKAAAMKSLRMCTVASEALKTLVQELEKNIVASKKRGAFKAALKKDKVDRFRERLESAKSTMLVANHCYHGAVQRQNWAGHEHDMFEIRMAVSQIAQSASQINSTSLGEYNLGLAHSTTCKMAENGHLRPRLSRVSDRFPCGVSRYRQVLGTRFLEVVMSAHEHNTTTSVSIRLPKWLYARRFDIAFKRSCQGWDQSFRTYRLISSDALVITYSKTGNVAGLKDLFRAGLASPFEADSYGATPLHVGCPEL